MSGNTKRLTTLAMLISMAYIVGFFIRIRFMGAAPFLTYDAKDVIIVLGGLMFGPFSALLMSVTLAFLEMITHSGTGHIGFLMNSISSATFACTASYIYMRRRTLDGAIIGIIIGVIVVTVTMLLWNYIMVPIFNPDNPIFSREAVAPMLLPVFLPFNLIKASLNGAMVLMVYKPITNALKAAKLYDSSEGSAGKLYWGLMGAAAFVALSLILLMIVM